MRIFHVYIEINKGVLEQEPLKAKDPDIEKGESHQKSELNEEEAEGVIHVSNDFSFNRFVSFHTWARLKLWNCKPGIWSIIGA